MLENRLQLVCKYIILELYNIKVKIIVIAVNLATAMKCVAPNKSVGLLDADVFGPSIPLMMNLHDTPLINDGMSYIAFILFIS